MSPDAVAAAAPPAPACFHDRAAWVDYLIEARQDKNCRPFVKGVFRPEFNFCNDCLLSHSSRMQRVGRCNPSTFVNFVPAPAATHGQ